MRVSPRRAAFPSGMAEEPPPPPHPGGTGPAAAVADRYAADGAAAAAAPAAAKPSGDGAAGAGELVEVARTRLHTAEAAKDGGGTGSEATSRPRRPSQLLRRRSAAGKSFPEKPFGSIMPRIIMFDSDGE